MNVYKVEVLIIDHDDLGASEIQTIIENTRYPNHSLSPEVMSIESADIGEWHDDHPLNSYDTTRAEYNRLFKPQQP
jgi:hypothetical protein